MLKIAEQAYRSDVGRQRQGNEDNFFVRAPVFVVADGMGGAQAGEVASQMAVEAFEPGLRSGSSPEDALTEIIQAANNRIHEMSRSDSQRSGMGTTTTAAYVDEREVVLAHVGDSRCYLYRDGELTRLTRDHSLVGELVDRGKLTEEQAEIHPQRSVITRALGPEMDVRVDVERVEARDGDVFLLCSDGLTSMVREPGLLPLLERARSLDEAAKALIAAANEAGGRDNITVVLFRLEDVDVPATASQATVEAAAVDGDGDGYEDYSGPVESEPRQGITRMSQEEQPTRAAEGAPATGEVAAGVQATDEQEAAYQQDFATTAIPAIPAPAAAAPPSAPADPAPTPTSAPPPAATRATAPPPGKGKEKRRLPRWLKALLVVLAVLVVIGLGLYGAARAVFFVGTDDDGVVTVFRGLPYELPGGIDMYTRHYTSGVTLEQVPPARRETFTEHKLRSLDDASDLVEQLELGKLNE